ncbi:phage tail tape measure protein [Burkholderia contaminans]|uniref:phage tail tape measure protein n=1 Tax=Burkholderia contaminans TaxID=488447 RepID=UPI000F5A8771|nr:phage tail tape measure protein [Burkholderia contaminans]RQT19458.1 phage tail tape measure protein [Burkholderia contaminans]
MAGENQVQQGQLDLSLGPKIFQDAQSLSTLLTEIFKRLNDISGIAKQISIPGVSSTDPSQSNILAAIGGLQRDMRTMLATVRSGGPQAQINQALVQGTRSQALFGSDNRAQLEQLTALNAAAERRVLLERQLQVAQEANREYSTSQMSAATRIYEITTRITDAQQRYKQAIIDSDTATQAAAKRDMRDGQQRLDQLKQEIDLRERGARVRLGRALDSGQNVDVAQAQLAIVNADKADISTSLRTTVGAQQRAEREAAKALSNERKQLEKDWTAALTEERSRQAAIEKAWNQAIVEDRQRTQRADATFERQLRAAQVEDHKRARDAEASFDKTWNSAHLENLKRDKATERKFLADWDAAILEDHRRSKTAQKKLEDDWDSAIRENRRRQQQADEAAARAAAQFGPDRATLMRLRDAHAENNRRNSTEFQDEQDAATRARRYRQTFGDGGASVALTQTALLANYSVTRGVQTAFTSALQNTIQYEEALAHLKTITSATDLQLASLASTIETVSNATRYSATDLTKAAAALSETGVTTNQLGVALRGVADLATATGEDFNKTVDTVTGSLGAFKMSASDTVQVTNMIAQAVNSSRLTMDKLKTSIETAGETASEAGVSFKEMLSATVSITNTGTASGATLGGGLRQLLIDLEKPSQKFKATLDQLGLTQEDINVKSQGLYGALKNLKDAGFTAADAMQAFEARSASAFTALSGNLSEMNDFSSTLNHTDAAVRANAEQMETLGAQYDRFKNQTSLLVGEGFTPLLDGLKHLLDLTSSAETALKNYAGVTETVGTLIGTGALAIGLKYVGGLLGGIAGMTFGGFEAAAGLAAMGGQVGLVLGAIAGLTAGVVYLVNKLNDSKQAFEDQRTAVNAAKDAVTSSKQSYDSIGRQIDTLRYKMAALNEHPEQLKREIDDVSVQFEKYGVTLDKSAISKTEDLIDRLQRLQVELGKRYEMNTSVLGAQLDVMVERAKEAAGQAAGDFQKGAFSGPRDKLERAPGMSTPGVGVMDESALSGYEPSRFNALPGGRRSAGYLPIDEGVNKDTIPAIIQYLKDAGADVSGKVQAGLVDAAGINGQPRDLDAQSAFATAVNAAIAKAIQARTTPGISDAEKANSYAEEQALSNLLTNLQKVTNGLQTAQGYQHDLDRTNTSLANQRYANSNPAAQEIVNAVTAAVTRTRGALGSPESRLDALWTALKTQESGNRQFDANGRPITSSKGAIGIAQVMPDTAPEAAQLAGLPWDDKRYRNDAAYNEAIGRAYLNAQLKKYGNNSTLALAAYNGGPGYVDKLLATTSADGRSMDFRNPTGVTETEFVNSLKPETRNYVQRIGSGAGAFGRYQSLLNNPDLANQGAANSQLMRQLQTQLDASDDEIQKTFLRAQIDRLKVAQNDIQRKIENARVEAAPTLKATNSAAQRALQAQLAEVDTQAGITRDPEKARQLGDVAVELIKNQYNRAIDTLRRTSPTLQVGDHRDYADDVKQQLQSLQNEMDAKVRSQIDKNAERVRKLNEQIKAAQFKEDEDRARMAFNAFMTTIKGDEKTRASNQAIELKRNSYPVIADQAASAYMSDPRYSAQFSQVQRQSLSLKAAADQDVVDARNLVTYQANIAQLRGEIEQLRKQVNARTAMLGEEGDGTGSPATGLYAQLAAAKADPAKREEQARLEATIVRLTTERTTQQGELNALQDKSNALVESQERLQEKLAAKTTTGSFSLMQGINEANKNFLDTHNATSMAIDGYASMLNGTDNALIQFFDDLTTHSKTAGQAVRDFGVSFLKMVLQILEQQAALMLIKGVLSMFGTAASASAAPAATGGFDMPSTGTALAVQGGSVSNGLVSRSAGVKRFVSGGSVTGGMPGRDSVHALLKEGEYVLNDGAVSTVGTDFLDNLNAHGNRVISKSTPAPKPEREKQPQHVNVWVVAPDQKPQMGPNDVVAAISNDIVTGGSTKKLIKQVALGQM